jgi:hypothetical protein
MRGQTYPERWKADDLDIVAGVAFTHSNIMKITQTLLAVLLIE